MVKRNSETIWLDSTGYPAVTELAIGGDILHVFPQDRYEMALTGEISVKQFAEEVRNHTETQLAQADLMDLPEDSRIESSV